MTQMNRYRVTVVVGGVGEARETQVEVLAYNKRQAERKAANQCQSRSSRLLSSHAEILEA